MSLNEWIVDLEGLDKLAEEGRSLLDKYSECDIEYNRDGVACLQKYMIHLWTLHAIQPHEDNMEAKEWEQIFAVGAFLGKSIICSIGGHWGRSGPYLEGDYFVLVDHPNDLIYKINPFGRVINAHFNPLMAPVIDFYDRAKWASTGTLDALLMGRVDQMILPSLSGRVIVSKRVETGLDLHC